MCHGSRLPSEVAVIFPIVRHALELSSNVFVRGVSPFVLFRCFTDAPWSSLLRKKRVGNRSSVWVDVVGSMSLYVACRAHP